MSYDGKEGQRTSKDICKSHRIRKPLERIREQDIHQSKPTGSLRPTVTAIDIIAGTFESTIVATIILRGIWSWARPMAGGLCIALTELAIDDEQMTPGQDRGVNPETPV